MKTLELTLKSAENILVDVWCYPYSDVLLKGEQKYFSLSNHTC